MLEAPVERSFEANALDTRGIRNGTFHECGCHSPFIVINAHDKPTLCKIAAHPTRHTIR
jgi:hypothetical protein